MRPLFSCVNALLKRNGRAFHASNGVVPNQPALLLKYSPVRRQLLLNGAFFGSMPYGILYTNYSNREEFSMFYFQPYVATVNIFEAANTVLSSFYGKLVAIDTLVAVVALVVCIIMRQVTTNERTIGTLDAWMKRIVKAWIVINVLGAIIAYVEPLLKPYQYETTKTTTTFAHPLIQFIFNSATFVGFLHM
jgi:hypothetical protein